VADLKQLIKSHW